jgi:hypothetical protein
MNSIRILSISFVDSLLRFGFRVMWECWGERR